jgi:hypothetical protein
MAIFYTGNTGRSTGEHLDFRVWDVNAGAYTDPTRFTSRMRVGDDLLTDTYPVTSGYQPEGRTLGGVTRPHMGIDYGTPSGTAVLIDGGKYLTTFNDEGGGGITSQYSITGDDGNPYEILLMHGSDQNKILSAAAITDGVPLINPDPSTPSPTADSDVPAPALDYSNMTGSQLNAEYDKLRMAGDVFKAEEEGMKMHKAFFKK